MRLPHFLTLAPSGVFHFRMRVPPAQRLTLGREVRASLRTRDRRTAQLVAQVLAQRYALAFSAGAGTVEIKKDLIDEAVRALEGGAAREKYKLKGSWGEIEANNAEEHAQALEVLGLLREVNASAPAPAPAYYYTPPPLVLPPDPLPRVTLQEAFDRWSATLDGVAMPAKTRSIKRCAVREFVEVVGGGVSCAILGRGDVGRWSETLRGRGKATPTIRNKACYIEGFFNWAASVGIYPQGDNPAKGVVTYGKQEKRHRRKEGFCPFSAAQVAALYAPAAMAHLSPAARWGALLGLYTGARVSEIAQARLEDFAEVDGVLCLSITDEGESQSLKNDGSRRVVPIHPDLLALGLRERVEALRAAGETRFFPSRRAAEAINGPGNWLSKAWSFYIKARGLTCPPPGRLGFHSLRKSFTRTLQDARISAEVRAAMLGHELNDEHHAAYSRGATIAEKWEALTKGLRYGLALDELSALLK